MLRQVALVSEVDEISPAQLSRVAAALQKQVSRDFGPIWEVSATVDAFPTLDDVPVGYWPVVVRYEIDDDAAGYHKTEDGQPLALVVYAGDWALTCSHECLEMLADPSGDRLVAGQSPKEGQGRVLFLVEVCDPSEDGQFAYTVNGVAVSDFYTPHFFDPVENPGARYSFTGAIERPHQVLEGGYLSWFDPQSRHLWQQTWFKGPRPKFVDHGAPSGRSLREFSDSQTPLVNFAKRLSEEDPRLAGARGETPANEPGERANASLLREQIEALSGP